VKPEWRRRIGPTLAARGLHTIRNDSKRRDVSSALSAWSSHRAQFLDDLGLGRKAIFLCLRKDQLVVDDDVEDSAAEANDLRFESELFLDLGRQTGGPWKVVSNAAVFDRDGHADSLISRERGWR
jgi:hypothetical protein